MAEPLLGVVKMESWAGVADTEGETTVDWPMPTDLDEPLQMSFSVESGRDVLSNTRIATAWCCVG
jgi:hypothetical protein